MIGKLDIIEAEQAATSVIEGLSTRELPIDPYAIAIKNEIYIEPEESRDFGISGFLVRVGNVFGIKYATRIRNEGFIRFTVAHELGHYFIPGHCDHLFPNGDGRHQSRSGFISFDPYEQQADHFAKALLMPEELFRAAIEEAGEGFPAISHLAERCKTSITASGIRYAQLVEDPVATILSSDGKVSCCFLSDSLASALKRISLRKGSPVPRGTSTYELNANAKLIAHAEHRESWTRLDAWFDEAPSLEAKEDAVGLGSYGKVLTVLFTSEPTDTDEDDERLEIGDTDRGWKWA